MRLIRVPSDAASAIALEEGPEYFAYYGRGERIPRNVTHVRIDSSVRGD
jgi:hypothetical protein